MPRKAPEIPDKLPVAAAAMLLGVSARQVRYLAAGEGCLVVESGHVTFASLCAQLAQRATAGEGAQGYEADKARDMKAKADLSEIEAAKAAGAVVLARSVEKVIEAAVSAAKEKLDAVGPSVAAKVLLCKKPRDVSEMITAANRSAMQSMFEMEFKPGAAAYLANDAEDGEEAEPQDE